MTIKVNAIILSDTHLGYSYSRPDRLVKFLKRYSCNILILNGDIIELFGFPNKFKMTYALLDVFKEFIRLKQEGCRIVYIPGNHDSFFREHGIGDAVEVYEEFVYVTLTGERALVIHGDAFDTALCMKMSPTIYRIGDFMYTFSIFMNNKINAVRKFFGFEYWSFSHFLKTKVKNAISYLTHFEEMVVERAKTKDCTIAIAGHIHVPCDRMIDGIRYMNSGSWLSGEGVSYIIEDLNGELKLFHEGEQ